MWKLTVNDSYKYTRCLKHVQTKFIPSQYLEPDRSTDCRSTAKASGVI